MTGSSQNPFADRVKGDDWVAAELVQPAAPADNPYASPREAGQHIPEPIGLWRDGKFVVAHRDSAFPLICIRTNEAAERGFRCDLLWSYPIDIWRRRVRFDVGLCESCIRRYRRIRIAGWSVLLIGVAMLVLAIQGAFDPVWPAFGVIALLVVGIFLASRPGVVLSIKRVKGPYFWIRGAHRGFLDRLPVWPGISSS